MRKRVARQAVMCKNAGGNDAPETEGVLFTMIDETTIRRNLSSVRKRIQDAAVRAGRDPRDIRLVAVTKTVGVEEVKTLYRLGQREFGENRVADAQP